MEARSTLSGSRSYSTLQPIRDLHKRSLFSSSSFSSPSSSQILFPKRVSFENLCYSLATKSVSIPIRSLQEVDSAYGVDNETGIRRKNLAVFVSGGGSNFRSIHEATLKGSVHGEVVVLVTNKSDCGGAKYARDSNIPVILFPKSKAEPEGLSSNDLVYTLRSYKIDFILLAGYLKLIPIELVRAFQKSIFNIHPSLLPAFGGKGYYGMKVHQAVIASGARYSGPTIHFVDEQYDTGRILAQRVVPVLTDDTENQLAARVLQKEHELYVEVAAALCEERIVWREDGVPIIRNRENPNKFS